MKKAKLFLAVRLQFTHLEEKTEVESRRLPDTTVMIVSPKSHLWMQKSSGESPMRERMLT